MKSMLEIASLLDETIQKGEALSKIDDMSISEAVMEYRRVKKAGGDISLLAKSIFKKRGGDFRKSLSHNPFEPVEMSSESGFHNPYRQLEDGSYCPHPAKHWMDQSPFPVGGDVGGVVARYPTALEESIRRDGYGEVDRFYQAAGVTKAKLYSEIDEIVKAIPAQKPPSGTPQGGVPIGTVHNYNGVPFKKEAPGVWNPVRTGKKGVHPIEADANARVQKLAKILKDRKEGKAQEPSFDDRASLATQKHKDLSAKEADLEMRSRKAKDSDLNLRESETKKKEDEIGQHSKKLEDHSKKLEEYSKKADLEHQYLSPENEAALKEKIARKGAGQGREVKLSKAELSHLLKSGSYALVSAGRNFQDEADRNLDDAAIKKRHNQLKKELKKGGYAHTSVKGKYGGEEDSFLVMVHEADRAEMIDLGRKFNQDSIIISDGGKHEAIHTTGPNAGKVAKGDGFEERADADDYYTEIPHDGGGKSKFSLKIDWGKLSGGWSGKEEKAARKRTGTAAKNMVDEPPPPHYNQSRSKLHKAITDKFLDGVKPMKKPIAILTGGGSGSGKSAVVREAMEKHKQQMVHIDADAIKGEIPEYQAGVKAGFDGAAAEVHDESSDLTSDLIEKSIQGSKPFVYDSTMSKPEKFKGLVDKLKAAGFDVHVFYADLPKEEAMKRAEMRAKTTGRKVPEDMINETHANAPKTLAAIANNVDGVHVYSTMGDKPELKYHRDKSGKKVDSAHLKEMQSRGHMLKSDNDGLLESFTSAWEGAKVDRNEEIPSVADHGVSWDEYPRDRSKEDIKKARVVSIGVRNGSKILMGKRKDSGKWTTPGGHVEDHDTDLHAAAVRELHEETGIKKKELKPIGQSRGGGPSNHEIHMFETEHRGAAHSGSDPDSEVDKWEWVDTEHGLPKHINENLHSPKNTLLEHYGIKHGPGSRGGIVVGKTKSGNIKYQRKTNTRRVK